MKSYLDSIADIKSNIAILKKHVEIIKKYPPTKIYLIYKDTLLIPYKYSVCLETWRNKIIFTILASNDWGTQKENGQPDRHSLLMGQLMGHRRTRLAPIKIKDLSLYIHLKNKTPLFEKIIKIGKLPRR